MSTAKLTRPDVEHIFNAQYRKEEKRVWRNDRSHQAAVLRVRGKAGEGAGAAENGHLQGTAPAADLRAFASVRLS